MYQTFIFCIRDVGNLVGQNLQEFIVCIKEFWCKYVHFLVPLLCMFSINARILDHIGMRCLHVLLLIVCSFVSTKTEDAVCFLVMGKFIYRVSQEECARLWENVP